jgi:hypothetical protein
MAEIETREAELRQVLHNIEQAQDDAWIDIDLRPNGEPTGATFDARSMLRPAFSPREEREYLADIENRKHAAIQKLNYMLGR